MMAKTPKIIISSSHGWISLNLRELWEYRELFYAFAWRDIKVRYKQTILGAGWAVFQPLASMVVFTIFFGNFAKVPSGNMPYPLFVYIGLVFWIFFSGALTQASSSLIGNENIIKKVYFPRLILPLSSVVVSSVDLTINLLLLVGMCVYFRLTPPFSLIIIILLAYLISSLAAAGLGLSLSALTVKYRDIRHVMPFFIQMLLFLTPVIYPVSLFKSVNKLIFALNPMTGVIESVRTIVSGSTAIDPGLLSISLCSAIIIFLIGLILFNTSEKSFADVL